MVDAEPVGEHERQAKSDEDEDIDIVREKRDLQQVIMMMALGQRGRARETHAGIVLLVASFEHNRRRFGREAEQRLRAAVSEVHFAPRVTDAARLHSHLGRILGLVLDITASDDLPETCEKAERLLDAQKPALCTGRLMCMPFSNLQRINDPSRDPEFAAKEKAAGWRHLEWCCHLYRKQVERGAYFLHEHSVSAKSWSEPCVARTLQLDGVTRIRADQGHLGQQTIEGDPIKKPTGFMSNSKELLRRQTAGVLGGTECAADGAVERTSTV